MQPPRPPRPPQPRSAPPPSWLPESSQLPTPPPARHQAHSGTGDDGRNNVARETTAGGARADQRPRDAFDHTFDPALDDDAPEALQAHVERERDRRKSFLHELDRTVHELSFTEQLLSGREGAGEFRRVLATLDERASPARGERDDGDGRADARDSVRRKATQPRRRGGGDAEDDLLGSPAAWSPARRAPRTSGRASRALSDDMHRLTALPRGTSDGGGNSDWTAGVGLNTGANDDDDDNDDDADVNPHPANAGARLRSLRASGAMTAPAAPSKHRRRVDVFGARHARGGADEHETLSSSGGGGGNGSDVSEIGLLAENAMRHRVHAHDVAASAAGSGVGSGVSADTDANDDESATVRANDTAITSFASENDSAAVRELRASFQTFAHDARTQLADTRKVLSLVLMALDNVQDANETVMTAASAAPMPPANAARCQRQWCRGCGASLAADAAECPDTTMTTSRHESESGRDGAAAARTGKRRPRGGARAMLRIVGVAVAAPVALLIMLTFSMLFALYVLDELAYMRM